MCEWGVDAAEKLSYAEVKERMNIPDEDALRLLHSLACAKYKILLKDPPGKNLTKQDSFSMNTKFTSTMRRLKVGNLPLCLPCLSDARQEYKSAASCQLPAMCAEIVLNTSWSDTTAHSSEPSVMLEQAVAEHGTV